jgi:S1-C subfamily serine protease
MSRLFLFLLISVMAWPQENRETAGLLEPGRPASGRIGLPGGSVRYSFRIPAPAFGVRIELSDTRADLALSIMEKNEVLLESGDQNFPKRLVFTRLTDPAAATGEYQLELAHRFAGAPLDLDRREAGIGGTSSGPLLDSTSYHLSLHELNPAAVRLEPGAIVRGTLLPEEGMAAAYVVDVPESTRVLRFDVFDASADVDLLAARGGPALDLRTATFRAEGLSSRETIIVKNSDGSFIESGAWYVSVVNLVDENEPTSFSIRAALSAASPAAGGLPEGFPGLADGLERAVLATVEVIGSGSAGSGSLIDADGRILTCYHVIQARDGRPDPSPIIAMSLEAGSPPRELFRARVEAFDEKLDLALLKVTSGLYGEALPAGLKFPFHAIAAGGRLSLGETIEVLGYPGTGGLGSKPSITLTRGVVSGFENGPRGRFVKTDAAIAEGNSGGAVLNGRRELVGVPVRLVSAGSGILAYLLPLDQVPAAWLKK